MVVIRLSPSGKKGDTVYKVTVCGKGAKLTGNFIEKLGIYKPGTGKKDLLELNTERYSHWLSKGAVPSARLVKVIKTLKPEAKVAAPVGAAAPSAKAAPAKAAPAQAAVKTPAKKK